ncbi:MAG: HNH endonuclease family protein [Kibdelosporangium sp.]
MPVLLLLSGLSGCAALPGGELAPTTSRAVPAVDHVPAGTPDAATARAKFATLQVAAPVRAEGYVRDCDKGAACVFGQPWADVDGDGCDQRSQVLARDLENVVRKNGRCGVQSGELQDPYTGETITNVSKIQIDHVVPLAAMWRSGASGWTVDRRTAAANDLRNLVAVKGTVNQSKSDKTPDEWMPPNAAYTCSYARIYVGVKADYGLTVSTSEHAALEKALATCG